MRRSISDKFCKHGSSTDEKIKANYSKLRQNLIRLTPENYQCKWFCGGANCKYCNVVDNFPLECQAIPGLFSHWITENIIASSRPVEAVIEKMGMIPSFTNAGIRSVVNLQRHGEHSHCGPPLRPAGFSYDPENFMKVNIFHYNFGWPDFGVASMTTLLDMVKVFSFALSQGKVLVHCHAGLGRTGVIICCYLIWSTHSEPSTVIQRIRETRPGSVQTTDQVQIIYQFADFMKPLRQVFSHSSSLSTYCERQRLLLHGYEQRILKHLPKILYVICERLLEISGKRQKGEIEKKLCDFESGDDIFYDRIISHSVPASENGKEEGQTPSNEGNTDVPPHKNSFPTSPSYDSYPTICPAYSDLYSGHPEGFFDESCLDQRSETDSRCSSQMKYFISSLQTSTVDMQAAINSIKVTLNGTLDSWLNLAREDDPLLLLVLMNQWFVEMKVNIGSSMSNVENSDGIQDINSTRLKKVEKETLLYLANTFALVSQCDKELEYVCASMVSSWLFHGNDTDKTRTLCLSCIEMMKRSVNAHVSRATAV